MILPFIVIGLVAGSVYGLAAVGLVLTYKTSGVFNFAHGAVAAAAAYLFYTLHVQHHMAWPAAAAITVFGLGPVAALLFERFAKGIGKTSLTLRVAGTVGVLLVIEAAIVLIYGTEATRTVPVFLAHGQFHIGSTTIQNAQAITVAIAVIATATLSLYFRFTRAGAAMRAVVESPDLLEISGTSAVTVRRMAWLIGTCFACASGVLFSSTLPLDPVQLTLLVVAAFGAAAIGAFSSLPITFAGGLAIGVAASVATKYFTTGLLAGIPASMPFIVLFVVLLTFPKRYLVERSFAAPSSRPTWTAPPALQVVGGVVVLALLALVPSFAGIHLTDWTTALANVILFLSLGLLVRTSGQVSLCHVSFLAIGATAFAHFAGLGLPWLVAFPLACLVAVPVGALLAVPAIRLSPLYLALATFGFGIFLQYMFYPASFMFGNSDSGLSEPRPSWFGFASDTGFYYFLLIAAAVAAVAVIALNRSRLGRLLRGIADSPTALATSGADTRIAWVLVFCLSAAMAAGAGALAGMSQQLVSSSSYPPLESLTYFALIIIVAGEAPWYALLAAIPFTVIPSYLTSSSTSYWLQIVFGVFAILYAITPPDRRAAPAFVRAACDGLFRRPRAEGAKPSGQGPLAPPVITISDSHELRAVGLDVRFGGLVAVSGVVLTARPGQVTGLIGPNGAGKTTTFNVCSGLVTPTAGKVSLGDHDITRARPATRAQRGLGRTFQQMQLFDSLTVAENVALGAEATLAGSNPVRHLVGRRGDARLVSTATAHALELCELEPLADVRAAELSTGQRRLVELARCISGPFGMLLLDEPSSGLDAAETERFGEILERVIDERGVGILLVEHDMSLVMKCCGYIYVLDFGQLIFEGTPDEVRASPVVRAAYLGDQHLEEIRARERSEVSVG
jgi:ABC-type branched-subunit amino acid transport system ATPase component/branched-subunit amino acid ABC-type transport system permease component